MSAPLRGQVYHADIGFGPKPWLVVSNNHRNRALSDLLAVRITTTDRHANLPTWVPLGASDPLVGYAGRVAAGSGEGFRTGVLITGALPLSALLRAAGPTRTVW